MSECQYENLQQLKDNAPPAFGTSAAASATETEPQYVNLPALQQNAPPMYAEDETSEKKPSKKRKNKSKEEKDRSQKKKGRNDKKPSKPIRRGKGKKVKLRLSDCGRIVMLLAFVGLVLSILCVGVFAFLAL